MKKIYLFLFTVLISAFSLTAQVEIFNLNGGGAFPGGWTDNNNITTNDIDRGSYYLLDAGAPGDEIITPSMDLSSYTSATFDFSFKSFGSGNHIETKIEISYDGGNNFTETTLSPITTSNYTTFSYTLLSVSNQTVIKLTSNGTSSSDRGIRLQNIKLIGNSAAAFIGITAPTNNAVFASGTTSIDVILEVLNFNVAASGSGDGYIKWTLNSVAQADKTDTTDEAISVVDGGTYTVYMELVDNSGTAISPAANTTLNFSVAYPCDLQIGTITTTCNTETIGVDTYNTTIEFTNGGTSTYTIDTGSVGTVAGADPSSVASGTITITNITEGTDFTVNFTGDSANSSCNIFRNISSPTCVPSASCPAVGSLIITEIMKNPTFAADNVGEYFEVYNTTGTSIDMIGMEISDQGSDSHIIASSLIVPASGYVVLGINEDSAVNGGIAVDYEYSGIIMSNGNDEIQIVCAGDVIDLVAYTDADFPDTAGVSMELDSDQLNSTDNDLGANWANATNTIGSGTDLGTPGAENDFTLSANSFSAKNEFKIYPNPTNSGLVNIQSTSTEAINVIVFDILGKQISSNKVLNNKLDVSNLNAGVYLLNITQNNLTTTKKLVVK